MKTIDAMNLFVRVVNAEGLAAAGRQIGLSPATMTARINALEKRYNTKLLYRTTRKISLTDSGRRFYEACQRVLAEVDSAETLLLNDHENLTGQLRVTAPSDFGRQYVAPALAEFTGQHSEVIPNLYLSDSVINLVEYGYDLGIRYGHLPDSNLVVRHLSHNHRVLVGSPKYFNKYGAPHHPDDLKDHRCLVMERLGEPLNSWSFSCDGAMKHIRVAASLMSNDGAVVRQWALAGCGVAYKSFLDIQCDLEAGKLQTVLDDFVCRHTDEAMRLQFVYPSRQYVPRHVAEFIRFFKTYLNAD